MEDQIVVPTEELVNPEPKNSDDFELLPTDTTNSKTVAITRLIVALVTILNIIAASFGWQPLGLDGQLIYDTVSGIAAIVALIWAWWKNNNMTKAAMYGQYVTNEIKETL